MGMAANYGNTRVKFLKSWQGYNAGDIAGFAQKTAQKLVSEGVAAFDKVIKPAPSTPTGKPALNPKPKKGGKKGKRKPKPKAEDKQVLTKDDIKPPEPSEPSEPAPDPVDTDKPSEEPKD